MDECVRSEVDLDNVFFLFWSTALSPEGLFLMVVTEAAWDRALNKDTAIHLNTWAEGRDLKSNVAPDVQTDTIGNEEEKKKNWI